MLFLRDQRHLLRGSVLATQRLVLHADWLQAARSLLVAVALVLGVAPRARRLLYQLFLERVPVNLLEFGHLERLRLVLNLLDEWLHCREANRAVEVLQVRLEDHKFTEFAASEVETALLLVNSLLLDHVR